MSAAADVAAPPTDPDPSRVGARSPGAIGRIVALVRKLIDYGKQAASTLQQRASAPDFARFAGPFGTVDLAVILARITNGLRRAAALEARLCRRAARGQDLAPAPIRLPAMRRPRAARQAATTELQPPSRTEDPGLAHLPTEEEIAAEVRRRPIGAVIADICHDLGIAPGDLDGAFWNEISLAIIMYGGSLARFVRKLIDRYFALDPSDTAWSAAPPQLSASATGPP